MKIQTCLSKRKFKSKPSSQDAAIITSEIGSETIKLSLDQFANAISNGRTFSLATEFKSGVRKAANFKGIQIFAADIDDFNYSFSEIMGLASDFELGAPALVYESFSSTPEKLKWRVVYVSKIVVTDPTLGLAILRKIRDHFKSDRAIVDLARILYGTTSDKIHKVDESYFDPMTVDLSEASGSIKEADFRPNKKVPKVTKPLTNKAKFIVKKVKYDIWFGQGPRYMSIFHGARKLAATGKLSQDDIESFIFNWIDKSERFKNYDRSDYDISNLIRNAISWHINICEEND